METMELRHIRYFLAVAEEGNFTRAAARLGIGQPPLSLQIKDLETEVGVPLFLRGAHGAVLTDAGRAFAAAVGALPQRAAEAIQAAQRAARGEIGSLNVGFTPSAALNSVVTQSIRDYRRAHPQVALNIQESNSSFLAEQLLDGRLDVAILRPVGLDAAELDYYRCDDELLVVALPSTHPLATQRGRVDLGALRGEPLILTPRPLGPSLFDAAVAACRAAGYEPRLGPPAPQVVSILALVAAELGVALVPASLRQLDFPGVTYRGLRQVPSGVSLGLACRRGDASPFVQNFVDVFVQHVASAAPKT
jgi:DNA-binding transcriptional LysR family regulator